MEIAPGLMAWCALGAEGVSKDLKDKMLCISNMMGTHHQFHPNCPKRPEFFNSKETIFFRKPF
jgi:hypothetical protein